MSFLKLDLEKAYDKVSWHAILRAVQLAKFPIKLISWIETYISTPSLVNGQPSHFL